MKRYPFMVVYIAIALATATHTAWGASTTVQGIMPTVPVESFLWWGVGIAFAIAIDLTMLMIGAEIRNGGRARWLLTTFAVAAIASAYTQLIYTWAHAAPLPPSAGIPEQWAINLQGWIDLRIIVLPLLLPLISVLYTVSGLGHGDKPAVQKESSTHMTIEHVIKQEPPTEATPPAMQAPPARERLPLAMNTRKLPSGASGGLRTGILDDCVQDSGAGFVATCPKCAREFSGATFAGARNSLTAHMRKHVNVLEEVGS